MNMDLKHYLILGDSLGNVLLWITISTDAIVFVEDYNIFYIPDVAIEEKKIFPLSQAEVVIPEVIFHGIPDWIYEGMLEKIHPFFRILDITYILKYLKAQCVLCSYFCVAMEVFF